jgi:four helix bundle protein
MTRAVYKMSGKGVFVKDFALRDQICRAAISAMSNIAEGFEREGNAEFANFLSIAKGSTGEIEAQLYVAYDQGYITEAEFKEVRASSQSVKRLTGGLMTYLRGTEMKGLKFKGQNTNTRQRTVNREQ